MKVPSLEVGKQLQVGAGEAKALGKGTEMVRGAAYIEGPVQIGDDEAYDTITATVMIGREDNTDTKEQPEESLHVKGDVRIEGDTDQTGNMDISGDMTIGGTMKAGYATWSGSIVATTKLFDIQHPSKEGHRLAHGCLEGPEHAVYCRGRVCNGKNEIDLPSYWRSLIDYESLTVQLTAIHSHQNVIVKRISPIEGKIYLQAQGGMPVDCFYHIIAERIDSQKLIVEYEGKSVEESPNE
jgi:hypothetical protein|tara:strand:- start:143 stop:859 length:717 start_codon:yes stop_codon:yes gene_type:complete